MNTEAITQWRKTRDQISKHETDMEQRDLVLESARAAAEAAEARAAEAGKALAATHALKDDLDHKLQAAHAEAKSLEGRVVAAVGEADRLSDAAAHAAGVLVASLEAEVERREARNAAEMALAQAAIARVKGGAGGGG